MTSTAPPATARSIPAQFLAAQRAQTAWAARSLDHRLRFVKRVRHLLAARASDIAAIAADSAHRPISEALTSQVLPLTDALRFLEKRAKVILTTRRLGTRGRPLWLFGVASEIRREPLGVVLIIAPSNYPLLLPGVPAIQALVAGNAVLLKPGAHGTATALAFKEVLVAAGLDPDLIAILKEDSAAAREALALPIDKVFFTGSFIVGTEVLAALASRAIPCVAELSGCDAVFILEDADLSLAVRALLFGLSFNASATCIAPRRVFIARRVAERFEAMLCDGADSTSGSPPSSSETVALHIREALARDATALIGGFDDTGELRLPCVLTSTHPSMSIMQTAHFAPVVCIIAVDSDDEALALAGECPFALGATIFSADLEAARLLAGRVRAGSVVINDLIVPTADPRVPFGGRGQSGFGVTRGAEGLLEMTAVKVVQVRLGRARRHFAPPHSGDAELFQHWIVATHGAGFVQRARAVAAMIRTAWRRKP